MNLLDKLAEKFAEEFDEPAANSTQISSVIDLIKRDLSAAMKSFIFEPNDRTQHSIASMCNEYLDSMKQRRGIDDFVVVCDKTNNPPNQQNLKVVVGVRPTFASEVININFVLS